MTENLPRNKSLTVLILVVCFVQFLSFGSASRLNVKLPNYRNVTNGSPRFLGIFGNYIRAKLGPCTTSTGETGLCLNRHDCSFRGGSEGDQCAEGFGVCCIFRRTCGQDIVTNNTYFANREFPNYSTKDETCKARIPKLPFNVCQLRLDFDVFDMSGPDPITGNCISDEFTVSGLANELPQICGVNSKQHWYLDVPRQTGPIWLEVKTSPTLNMVRKRPRWNIKVTQVLCGSPEAAPPGCVQYHTERSGIIQSINYEGSMLQQQGGYPTGTKYAICIKKEPGMCATFSTRNLFSLSTSSGTSTNLIRSEQCFPSPNQGTGITRQQNDYLYFLGDHYHCGRYDPTQNIGVAQDRIQVTTGFREPLILVFSAREFGSGDNFQQEQDTSDQRTGFKLIYSQHTCRQRA